jgi:hypothetical protein
VSTLVSSPISAASRTAIDACANCHHVCLELLSSFLQPNGPKLDVERYQLLADCAEICEISANFMLSASTRSYLLCEICGPLCDETSESCRKVEDPSFQVCANAARRAAAACRAVVAEARSGRT